MEYIDTYRRFIQMYGEVVLGIDKSKYEAVLDSAKKHRGAKFDYELVVSDLQHIVSEFKSFTPFPEDPWDQLKCAVEAVFKSWFSPR
jgi:pyruvate,orthophosphate dikinase